MNAPAPAIPRSAAARVLRVSAVDRPPGSASAAQRGRIWGLDATQLHDLHWASRGVCVVRRAQQERIQPDARVYLLLEPNQLVLFDLPAAVRRLRRPRRAALNITIHEPARVVAPERFETDEDGRITAIRRTYRAPVDGKTAVLMTGSADVARAWRDAVDKHAGRRAVHLAVGLHGLRCGESPGWTERSASASGGAAARLMLMNRWSAPDESISDVREIGPGIWAHRSATIAGTARLIAPLWIGAGRIINPYEVVAGPQILDDAPGCAPAAERTTGHLPIADTLDLSEWFAPRAPRDARLRRLFDVAFSAAALMLAAPLMALIAVAILIDDGRPVLFAHKRQTLGGRTFNCYKFRTMRRDAEALKELFDQQNICDGPQFHILNDPRETRIGRWLRRFHVDELPQFFNVLAGHMSVIGPRPSPEAENRYCPAWRHARLSVKSGVTGLWQVRRTRAPHTDFQEWIRYDTEYVSRRSWWLDLWIVLRTAQQMILRK